MYRFLLIGILMAPLLYARGGGGGGGGERGGGEFGGDRGGYDSSNRGEQTRYGQPNNYHNDQSNNYNRTYSQEYQNRTNTPLTEQQKMNAWDRNHEVLDNDGGYYGGGYYGGYVQPVVNPIDAEFPNDPESNNYFNDPNWPNVQPGDSYNNTPDGAVYPDLPE